MDFLLVLLSIAVLAGVSLVFFVSKPPQQTAGTSKSLPVPIPPDPPRKVAKTYCVINNSKDIKLTDRLPNDEYVLYDQTLVISDEPHIAYEAVKKLFAKLAPAIDAVLSKALKYGLTQNSSNAGYHFCGYGVGYTLIKEGLPYGLAATYGRLFNGDTWEVKETNLTNAIGFLESWVTTYESRLGGFINDRNNYHSECYVGVDYYDFAKDVRCKVVEVFTTPQMGFVGKDNAPADVLVLYSGNYEKIFSGRLIPLSEAERFLKCRGF